MSTDELTPDELEDEVEEVEEEDEVEVVRTFEEVAEDYFDDDAAHRAIALAKFLDLEPEDLSSLTDNGDNSFSYGSQEYLVVDDDEADEAWEKSIENYIDDVVMGEIPKCYQNYFDSDAFMSDCKQDGRGHELSTYDGDEDESEGYYIYRRN